MMLTATFLLIALAAYALFGGADFGGGILEATLRRHPRLQRTIQETLAPVWEANHVWLIAVVVILFVGFPSIYASLCTILFVPISLMLLGIILRGAFFTFRKYDPDPAPRRALYSVLFRASSAVTPMMFGFIVAALLRPLPPVPVTGEVDFAEVYVRPWATMHGALCGLFVYALFGYVAAVFLFGEVSDETERKVLERRMAWFFAATFVTGGLVLGYGAAAGIVAVRDAWNPVQLLCQSLAALGIPLLWRSLRQRRPWSMRMVAGAQVTAILCGWFSTQYPVFMTFRDGTALTVQNAAAPAPTIFWLNVGLTVALAGVIPLLVTLYRVFDATRRAGNRY